MSKPKFLVITRFLDLSGRTLPTELIRAFIEFKNNFLPELQGDMVTQFGVEHNQPWRHVSWLTTDETDVNSKVDEAMGFLSLYDSQHGEPIGQDLGAKHIRDLKPPGQGFRNAEFLEPMNAALCKAGWRLKKYEPVHDPYDRSVEVDWVLYAYCDIRLEMFYFKPDSPLH